MCMEIMYTLSFSGVANLVHSLSAPWGFLSALFFWWIFLQIINLKLVYALEIVFSSHLSI